MIHDGTHDVEQIRAALSEDACALAATESTEVALGRVQLGVGVILVAAGSVDDDRVRFARWLRSQGLFSGAMLLLCRGRQSSDAFRLCRDGVFEDYVTIDPLYDTYRLRLSVHRALQVRQGERTQSALGKVGADIVLLKEATLGASSSLDQRARSLLTALIVLMGPEARTSGPGHCDSSARRARVLDELSSLSSEVTGAFASLHDGLTGVETNIQRVQKTGPSRVLLVDDDPGIYELIQDVIGSIGYAISWVEKPRDTVDIARKVAPHVILLDLEMPSMSGLEVLESIRADPQLRHVPVLLLTGRNDRVTVMTARRVGFQGYLLKPPKRDELVARLAQLVVN